MNPLNTIPTTLQIMGILVPIILLLITIIGLIFKFNNNIVKSQVALNTVVGKVAEIEESQVKQGNQISNLAGAFGQFTGKPLQI